VSRFFISWPWSDAARVVRAWQSWAPHAPDGLFSVCTLSAGAGGTPSVAAEGQFFGTTAQLRSLLRPLLNAGNPSSVSVSGSSYLAAVMHWAGCTGYSLSQCQVVPNGRLPRSTFKAKSQYVLKPLSTRGIETMIRWIEQRGKIRAPGSAAIILDSYGGAINRVAPGATAFYHRNALCSLQYGAFWSASASNATAQANLNWIGRFYGAMKPFVSTYAYQNYIDPNLANWQHAYYGSNLSRLVAVKKKYDPSNRFRFKQSIPTKL
jgi:hypothetical protein